MKYRKRPVVVEAVQWFKMGDHGAVCYAGVEFGSERFDMRTANGRVGVTPGTWIVTDPRTGDTWPVAEHIFAATYEPADARSEFDAGFSAGLREGKPGPTTPSPPTPAQAAKPEGTPP